MKKTWLLLLIVLLPGLVSAWSHRLYLSKMEDFRVYYTAAAIARQHGGALIYNDADQGADPQVRFADKDAVFAAVARQAGMPRIKLYIYPPILADLLIPLTFFSIRTAIGVWVVLNIVALLASTLLVAKLTQIRPLSLGTLVLLLAFATAEPVMLSFQVGQVTLLLLLLCTSGICLYLEGRPLASAVLFALAAVIKLTPLIVIAPLLAWAEWKWLRAYACSLLGFVLLMLLANTPAALKDYVLHVLPPMSNGIAFITNESIPGATQLAWFAAHGVVLNPFLVSIPRGLILTGKFISMAIVAVCVTLTFQVGARMTRAERCLTLALFAMLSAPVAPVSFRYAYVLALPALAILWRDALRARVPRIQLALMAICTLAVTGNTFQRITFLLSRKAALAPYATLVALVLPFGIASLVLLRLLKLRTIVNAAEPTSFERTNEVMS